MKISWRAIFAILTITAFNLATAQNSSSQSDETDDIPQAPQATPNRNMYLGSKIIGATVRDPQENKLGEIADLVLDSRRGEVAYVVVAIGGVMGMGSRYHPIPWKALQASDDGKYYVLHADRETVSKAPGFERGKWPDMADQKWNADVEGYWNKMVGQGLPGGIVTSSGSSSTPKGKTGSDGENEQERTFRNAGKIGKDEQ